MGNHHGRADAQGIVVLNGLIGFFQEYRAERAILALRSMTAPQARVRRDGIAKMIYAAENVPGVKIVRDHTAWVEPVSGLIIGPDTEVDARTS